MALEPVIIWIVLLKPRYLEEFMPRLEDLLAKNIVIGDGAMGTMLLQELRGRRCPEEAVLSHPDQVLSVHLKYIAAGAQLIETNTFGANAVRLREFDLQDRMEEINSRAVKLAREAREIAGKEVVIAGSIGPLGAIEWLGGVASIDVGLEYRRQAEILEQRGVEAFLLETFSSPKDLQAAVEAVHSVSSLPIIAQLTLPAGDLIGFDAGNVSALFSQVAHLPVMALGVNCGTGPKEILEILENIPRGRHVLSAYPNAGVPSRSQGRYVFPDSSPQYFAEFAREAARAGVRILGGCCGTRPEHIAAMAEALKDFHPQEARPVVSVASVEPVLRPPSQEEAPSHFAQKLGAGEFVVSIQIDPPKGTESGRLLEAVGTFKQSGRVDVVDVNSNPLARLHMDSLWMSLQVERLGLESLPHVTPRDASILGLQGNLLGAHAMGIRNLLVITGDPSVVGGTTGGQDVYQTDSVGLVHLISEMNEGRDAFGNLIGAPTRFFQGVAVNPAAPDLDLEIQRFRQKIKNGARFAMTQVFFDWEPWERFLDRLGEPCPIPVLIAIWPLTSHRLALRLHHEVPGIFLPERLLEQLEKAGKEARKFGFDLAHRMIEKARSMAQGVYIIAPFKDPTAALDLL
ncbi:MAG: bifunctional homocysteine S-methyltransferase/methylenetetrahydrofolate reductase [Acidobacteriota bacterium]